MIVADQSPDVLDQKMHVSLADSLEYIFRQSAELIDLNDERCNLALEKIRAEKTDPGIFARYYDLVFAIQEQDIELAARLIDEILEIAGTVCEFSIAPYSKDGLGDDYERFPRLIFAGFSSVSPMAEPDQALFETHAEKLKQAIEIIREVDPSIDAEINALISKIVVAVNNESNPAARSFGGITSFMTWGAIFINARHYASLDQVVEFLVHEVTHCVLNGLDSEGPLVLNEPSETYPSPLRSDLRPMDGIFHATLVCARLVLFMQKWRELPSMNNELEAWLDAQMDTYQQAFIRGSETIRKHAKLSVPAGDMFESACSLLESKS